jgi:uncharacterized protein YqeY
MAIVETISEKLKEAMKARDAVSTNALRNIRAAIITALKEEGRESIPDEEMLGILRKLAKQRKESIEAFEAGGRAEMAADEKAELAIIEQFLPKAADASVVEGWVKEAIATTGATTAKEMGKILGVVMKSHKDDTDAKTVQDIIRKLLP